MECAEWLIHVNLVALRLIFDVWIKERRLAFLSCLGDVFLSVEEFLYFLYPLACKLWCLIISGSESMSAEYTRQIGAGETLLCFVWCRKCFCELSLFCEPLIANSIREYRVPGMLDFGNFFSVEVLHLTCALDRQLAWNLEFKYLLGYFTHVGLPLPVS